MFNDDNGFLLLQKGCCWPRSGASPLAAGGAFCLRGFFFAPAARGLARCAVLVVARRDGQE